MVITVRAIAAKKTALVTGGAGFIGSHTVEALLAEGWRVRVLDNFSTGRADNLPADPALTVQVGDIRDPGACAAAAAGVDACLHLAAQVSVAHSVNAPAASAEHNIQGWLNVLDAARVHRLERVVYASSVAVFGDAKTLPLTEDTPRRPTAPYGLSKRINEDYARLFGSLYGLSTLGLRYFNVFGPRQRADSAYAGVITRFADNLSHGRPLSVYGDGTQSRDFIFVQDVAWANVAALSSRVTGEVNVGTGQRTSLLELIETLARLTGVEPELVFDRQRRGDIKHAYGDGAGLAHTLGIQPRFSLEGGLRALLATSAPA